MLITECMCPLPFPFGTSTEFAAVSLFGTISTCRIFVRCIRPCSGQLATLEDPSRTTARLNPCWCKLGRLIMFACTGMYWYRNTHTQTSAHAVYTWSSPAGPPSWSWSCRDAECRRLGVVYSWLVASIWMIGGSLEVKLPTKWTDGKAEVGRVRGEKRREEERRSEKRKSQRKEDAGARKSRKIAKHGVFPMICGLGGLKSRLAEAAGAEPAGQTRD